MAAPGETWGELTNGGASAGGAGSNGEVRGVQSDRMTGYSAVKVHYLDASALVKLVADDPDEEPGRDALRRYYHSHACRYATSYCATEAFSAFKLKFLRKQITEDQYIQSVRDFIQRVIGGNLQIDEVPILSPVVFTEAERLIKAYKIDFIDCFQLLPDRHNYAGTIPSARVRIAIDLDNS